MVVVRNEVAGCGCCKQAARSCLGMFIAPDDFPIGMRRVGRPTLALLISLTISATNCGLDQSVKCPVSFYRTATAQDKQSFVFTWQVDLERT